MVVSTRLTVQLSVVMFGLRSCSTCIMMGAHERWVVWMLCRVNPSLWPLKVVCSVFFGGDILLYGDLFFHKC
jgi:hypothetical protein